MPIDSSIPFTIVSFTHVLEELLGVFDGGEESWTALGRLHSPTIARTRRSMSSIFQEYGPYYTRRAYRMDKASFYKLEGMLSPYLKGSGYKGKVRGIPNGMVPTDLKLSMALRYFAGGDPYDIMISHGVSHSLIYESIWDVVEAVNTCPRLAITFPTGKSQQDKLVSDFQSKSSCRFNCCVGAIDGMLVWITKPKEEDCDMTQIGSGKYWCGRKKKYGLTLQAVCDANRRFLDVYIGHPASASDLLVFTQCPLKRKIELENLLHEGYAIFGDAAYMNNLYMVAPFRNASGGTTEDDFNFYQSQLRINIECAFGILTQRWGVLRKPMHSNMGLNKVTATVSALCRLHNYCLDSNQPLEPMFPRDDAQIATGCHVEEARNEQGPTALLGGGEHFDDMGRYSRLAEEAAKDV